MITYQRSIYYFIKPLIPRRLQIFLRRKVVIRKLAGVRHLWPIDEKASSPPEGWAGWPQGGKFALVLTHDVDTDRGQKRCRELMKLETDLGFRSSYNFVPLRYEVSRQLRDNLVAAGFEVGVHGLYHDGKYYTSRDSYLKRAQKINQVLKEWNSVGYRAPSMLHKLDWFHELNIEYDASTFDTDPFEPNSEGMRTIFPFLVKDRDTAREYVEMPYTLPQDFTSFVLLNFRTIDVWKEKLAWIVRNGGMALINVHPDYMHFGPGKPGNEEYPAHYYEDFLKYILKEYPCQFWHALPREAARYYKSTLQTPTDSG